MLKMMSDRRRIEKRRKLAYLHSIKNVDRFEKRRDMPIFQKLQGDILYQYTVLRSKSGTRQTEWFSSTSRSRILTIRFLRKNHSCA